VSVTNNWGVCGHAGMCQACWLPVGPAGLATGQAGRLTTVSCGLVIWTTATWFFPSV